MDRFKGYLRNADDVELAQNDDYGSTTSIATLVSVGSSTNGAIKYVGDYDYFRVEVPADGILTAVTTGSKDTFGSPIGINPATGLLSTLTSNNNIGIANKNFSISTPVTAGTYYEPISKKRSKITEHASSKKAKKLSA